jgi:release factor glutamine methyltransferase
MINQVLYNQLLSQLTDKLVILPDKPEENVINTLKSLWYAATNDPRPVQLAEAGDLPPLTTSQETKLHGLIKQRLEGIPLAHLTGRQLFMGVELLAGPEALVPRKETEILGNAAVNLLHSLAHHPHQIKVIDVCTGAANLAIAYAVKEPRARVFAADLSPDAVSLARKNVSFCKLEERVQVQIGDLLSPFDELEFYGNIDLVSCNPPYISSAKVDKMHDEISKHEPRAAFDGGPFGIKIVYRLISEAPKYLRSHGWLVFEVGAGQGRGIVKRLKKDQNFNEIRTAQDEQGEIRVIMARRASDTAVQ